MKTLKQSWIILIAMLVAAMALTACGENSKSGSERIGGTGDYINGGNNGNNGGDDNGDLDFCDDPDQPFSVSLDDIIPGGETDVSTGTAIRIKFSHEPDLDTIDVGPGGNIGLETAANPAVHVETFDPILNSNDPTEIVLLLKDALEPGATYRIYIRDGMNGSGIQPKECTDEGKVKVPGLVDENGEPADDISTEFTTKPEYNDNGSGDYVDEDGNPLPEGESPNPNYLKIIKTHPTNGESVTVEGISEEPPYIVFNQPVIEPDNCGEEGSLVYLEKTDENDESFDPEQVIDGVCELSDDGTTITLIPNDKLEENSNYILHIAGEEIDVVGGGVEGDITGGEDGPNASNPANDPANLQGGEDGDNNDVHFSTNGPLVGSIVLPGTAPGITNGDGNPVAGTDVEPEVHFNQPVDLGENDEIACGSEGSPVTLQNVDTGEFVSGTCHIDPDDANTVIFTPDSPLDSGDNYKLTVQAGEAGFQPVDPDAEPLKDPLVQEFGAADAMNRGACNASVIGPGDDKAEGVCLLGGPNGEGLVDALLDENGPLGPIASSLDDKAKAALLDDLNALLANPDGDGSLWSLLQALVVDEDGNPAEGGLANGLQALLIPCQITGDDDCEPTDIFQAILPGLVTGLPKTLTDGVGGLLVSLVTGNSDENCDGTALGNICLSNSHGTGAVDILLGGESFLTSAGLQQEQLTEALAILLDGDGSVPGLLKSLILDGNLVKGLGALLLGDGESGSPLVNALNGVTSGLGNALGGLLGLNGLLNPDDVPDVVCDIPVVNLLPGILGGCK